QITKYSLYPLTFSYNGSEEDDYVAGSECRFQFYCLSGKSATYNEIFESNYKDYQVVIYKNSELYWQGWLNPENLSKNFIGENYFISLSANDGIADLKEIEYPAVADTSARMSILEVIQNCLMQTGINLNIEIQLNTYENALMTSTEQALEKATILLSRVTEVKDNILSYKKCYDLIKELLKEFECRLIQAEGKWIITNKHELNSYKHVYLYSGTTRQSRTSITNIKNISDNKFFNRGDLSKIPPVKQAALIYQNKNLGESLLSYSSDFWTKSTENGFYVNYYSNYLEFSLVGSQIVSSTISPYIYSDAFYVENISDDDFLRVSFNYALDEDVQSLIEEYYYNIPKFRLLVKTPYDADFVAKATWDADSTEIQELSCDVPI
ncbi:MAG TPA: hypothetical protein PLG47_06285, partial [Candidatus Dojkabacteria bacterium]|nr:hypothetical protein [Candidatus Dojkabacteria bacterium]